MNIINLIKSKSIGQILTLEQSKQYGVYICIKNPKNSKEISFKITHKKSKVKQYLYHEEKLICCFFPGQKNTLYLIDRIISNIFVKKLLN